MLSVSRVQRGDADAALAHPAHVVTETFRTQAIEHAFLEPESCLAVPGRRDNPAASTRRDGACGRTIKRPIASFLRWRRRHSYRLLAATTSRSPWRAIRMISVLSRKDRQRTVDASFRQWWRRAYRLWDRSRFSKSGFGNCRLGVLSRTDQLPCQARCRDSNLETAFWYWIKWFKAWPFTIEALSGIFDFNRAPFLLSFIEVRVERSGQQWSLHLTAFTVRCNGLIYRPVER